MGKEKLHVEIDVHVYLKISEYDVYQALKKFSKIHNPDDTDEDDDDLADDIEESQNFSDQNIQEGYSSSTYDDGNFSNYEDYED
ncbi:10286_t:CDS:1, partial [Racocetra persica]